jgi:hypothetical protein
MYICFNKQRGRFQAVQTHITTYKLPTSWLKTVAIYLYIIIQFFVWVVFNNYSVIYATHQGVQSKKQKIFLYFHYSAFCFFKYYTQHILVLPQAQLTWPKYMATCHLALKLFCVLYDLPLLHFLTCS